MDENVLLLTSSWLTKSTSGSILSWLMWLKSITELLSPLNDPNTSVQMFEWRRLYQPTKCYGFIMVDFKTFWKWNENEELMHWWSAGHCNATYVICIRSHFLFFCLENLISSCPRIFSLSSKANFTASPLREHFNARQDKPQILTGQDEKSF